MSNKNDFRFITCKSLDFMGRDPECADMDNPQGFIYKECVGVEAISDYGEVFIYTGEVKDQSHGDRLVDIFTHQVNRNDFDIYNDQWRFTRNSYGSQAYQDNWLEEESYSQRLDGEY